MLPTPDEPHAQDTRADLCRMHPGATAVEDPATISGQKELKTRRNTLPPPSMAAGALAVYGPGCVQGKRPRGTSWTRAFARMPSER